jgi:hypothetical protein
LCRANRKAENADLFFTPKRFEDMSAGQNAGDIAKPNERS